MVVSEDIAGENFCVYCEGPCATPGWERFDADDLVWFWRLVCRGAKDREDRDMAEGVLSVTPAIFSDPRDPHSERSDVGRLIVGEEYVVGSTVVVDLAEVAELTYPNSPWAVAWHCTHSRRAANRERDRLSREAKAARRSRKTEIMERIIEKFGLSVAQGDELVRHNLDSRAEAESPKFLDDALALYRALPGGTGEPVDRRRLGQEVLGNPHALDSRRPLASFLLDILIVTGVATPRMRPREAWKCAGVLSDGVHDGMAIVGVAPVGMVLGDGLLVVLPPRTLATAIWPAPVPGREDVFITENPSILEAALGIPGLQMMCTLGTVYDSPSSEMLAALTRMGERDYRLHVRGDFDSFGLEHVGTLLREVPGAVPWRMSVADYLATTASGDGTGLSAKFPLSADWDPGLVAAMQERGLAGNEEALLEVLLADLEAASATPVPWDAELPALVAARS
jgi:uncharacterized protein (TIGR02679 family)